MTKTNQPNYPDILGYITGGHRINIGVIEAALAVHPPIVTDGTSFETVLLLQNTTDVQVEVTVEPKIPTRDAARKPDPFIAKTSRMVVTLLPAEVGYISMPIAVQQGVKPGKDYRVGMEVNTKPLGKPHRIRENSDIINLNYYFFINEKALLQIVELKALDFSFNKTGLLKTTIESSFALKENDDGMVATADLKPSWQRLWAMSDNTDTRSLLNLHRDDLLEKILPLLHRKILYDPLYKSTIRRFQSRGYPIKPFEAHYITKLLVAVLEMARKLPDTLQYPEQASFGVHALLTNDWSGTTVPLPLPLPHWCRSALARMSSDERILARPVKSLSTLLYDDLIRDGILHGFALTHDVIGRELGSRADSQKYADNFVSILRDDEAILTFEDVYLPLILGGIIVDAQVPLAYERPLERLHETYDYVRTQRPPGGPDLERILIYSVTCKVCEWSLQKLGYRM